MNELTKAVLGLIRHYTERQRLVHQFLSWARPDFLAYAQADHDIEVVFELMRQHAKFPFVGTWGNDGEWRYFIHGRGCKLTHSVTGEPIEWDVPDTQVFDVYWLANYLTWLTSSEVTGGKFQPVVAALLQAGPSPITFLLTEIEILISAGCISDEGGNRYRLHEDCG